VRIEDIREVIDESPFHLPYIHNGELYIASLGHVTVGWRYFGDWRVIFAQLDRGNIVERASFAVGMEKGKLEDVTISGPVP
jgi:hypothetical protein